MVELSLKNLSHHGSTPPLTYFEKKMDTLFPGVPNVIPCMKIKTVTELQAEKKNYLLKADKAVLGKLNNEIGEFKVVAEMVRKSGGKTKKESY